jgi:hypothetical protein
MTCPARPAVTAEGFLLEQALSDVVHTTGIRTRRRCLEHEKPEHKTKGDEGCDHEPEAATDSHVDSCEGSDNWIA